MNRDEQPLTFKSLFLPFTTKKAVVYLIIIGFMVYFNCLLNGFLIDDWGQIIYNVPLHSLTNILSFFAKSTFYVNGIGAGGYYYRPIMMAIYSLVYTFFGTQAFAYHLVQLMFHIANSILFLLFFNKIFSKRIAFCLSLIFLIHPINTESVVYIADMQEVLFFFFGMLSLLIIQKNSKRYIAFISCLIFSLLALFSKETGILFIFVSLFYIYVFKKHAKYYFALAIAAISYAFLRLITIGVHLQSLGLSNNTFIERVLSIPKIIYYYLSTLFWPNHLAVFQVWFIKTPTLENFYLPLIIDVLFFSIIGGFGYLLYLRKAKMSKAYFLFFLWFLLGLIIHLQIIPLDATVSDRWFYFPFVGLLGMCGLALTYLGSMLNMQYLQKAIIILLICIVALLSYRSYVRTFDWRNDYALCTHDSMINRNSYLLEFCLGNEYRKLGKYALAIHHFSTSLSFLPNNISVMSYLALSYYEQNDVDASIKYYRKVLANNDVGLGADMLSSLLAIYRDPKEAKETAQTNVKKQPGNAQLWYALSLANYRLGNKKEALEDANNAYYLAPNVLTMGVLTAFQNNSQINFSDEKVAFMNFINTKFK